MKYDIIGVERRNGEYEGKLYDNTYLHTVSSSLKVIGSKTETIKMKTSEFNELLKDNGWTSKDLIGKSADVTFDRYQRVEYFELLTSAGK